MIKLINWFKSLARDSRFLKARGFVFELAKILPGSSWLQFGSWVAIEVTDSDIKLLQLSRSRGVYRIDFFALLPLTTLLDFEKDLKNPEQLSLALARLIKRTHLKAKYVITAFPFLNAITTVITVQATQNTAALEQSILDLAEKKLIQDLDQLSLDYALLAKKNSLQDKQDVLLVAVQARALEKRVDLIEAAGLEVKVVDLDAYALGRGLQLLKAQIPKEIFLRVFGVLDLSVQATTLTVFSKQKLIFVNEERGGDRLIHARQLVQGFDAANEESIDFMVLSGMAATSNLLDALEQQLGMPIILADPCRDLKFGASINVSLLRENSSGLMTVLGLALWNFEK